MAGSGNGPMAGFVNTVLNFGSHKTSEILGHLSDYQLFKEYPAPHAYGLMNWEISAVQ
jgi:hypothetical protein